MLLIPAYEPLIALTIQGGIVVFGAALLGRWRMVKPCHPLTERPQIRRFSLANLMMATALTAVGTAIIANAPLLNAAAWRSVVLIGFCSGVASLTGYWVALQSIFKRQWFAPAMGILLVGAAGQVLAKLDWFYPSATRLTYPDLRGVTSVPDATLAGFTGWPPDIGGVLGSLRPSISITPWLGIICVGAVITFAATLTGRWLERTRQMSVRPTRRRSAVLVMAVATLLLAWPAMRTLWLMATPRTLRTIALPTPNGFDYFLTAERQCPPSLIVDGPTFDESTATTSQMTRAVGEVAPALATIRRGLTMSAVVELPEAYSESEGLDHSRRRRSAMRGFAAEGELAKRNDGPHAGLKSYLDLLDYGYAIRHGGLIADCNFGFAIAGAGRYFVLNDLRKWHADDCRRASERITELIDAMEPYNLVVERDIAWGQRALGWHGRLLQVLNDVANVPIERYASPWLNDAAQSKLLVAELSLQAYRDQQGEWPLDWADVEKLGLRPLAIDPYSPTGDKLQYRRTAEGYRLYSVGPNGVDDGGTPPPEVNTEVGDLLLEVGEPIASE